MKILHTGDWHVGRTIRGRSRAAEHVEVLGEIAAIAETSSVDVVLVAGDVFDTAAPSPESEQIVYRALRDLALVAPVVVIAGNHDNPGRLEAVAPFLELGRVQVRSRLAGPDRGGVIVGFGGLPLHIAAVPFVSQRGIVRAEELMSADTGEHGGMYSERLARVLARLCASLDDENVNVVVAHLMVHGGVLGGGERSAHTVFEYSVPSGAFPGHLSYVALGHLHRAQRIPASPPVWYAGSPLQLDFGEADDVKGVLVIDAEPGLPASVELIEITGGRRLRRIRGSLAEIEELAGETGDDYLKVELEEKARAGLADEVRALFPEAVDIVLSGVSEIPDEVGPARLGRDPVELFGEYLTSRNAEDPAVLALFSELLAEAHET